MKTMGFNDEWVAATNTTMGEFAEFLGWEIGDEVDDPSDVAITEIGDRVMVYSTRGDRAMTVDQIIEFSKGRSIVAHEEVDSVMFTHTTEYEDGQMVRQATVNLLVRSSEDEPVVTTVGLPKAQAEKLEKLNRKRGSAAYEEVTQMAQRIVGYRTSQHPQPKFWALVDNRPKPATVFERLKDWLLTQGFEEGGSMSKSTDFRRSVGDGFYVVVNVDSRKIPDDRVTVPRVYVGSEAVDALKPPRSHHQLTELVNDNSLMGSDPLWISAPDGEDPFVMSLARTKDLINQAEAKCSHKGLLEMGSPHVQTLIAQHEGWAEFEEYVTAHETLDWRENYRGKYRGRNVDPAKVPVELSDKPLAALREALIAEEHLSPAELATIQANGGAVTETCLALWFAHWDRAIWFPDLEPEIVLYLLHHRIFRYALTSRRNHEPSIVGAITLDDSIQDRLLDHTNPLFHEAPANPTITVERQEQAARAGSKALGRNPNITDEAQRLLAEHAAEPFDLYDLATNENVLTELVPDLAKSTHYQVREAIALNTSHNIPTDVLVKLSKDRKGEVKRAAARNTNLPCERQVEMAEMKDPLSLPDNPNLCLEAQKVLVTKVMNEHQRGALFQNDLDADLLVDIATGTDIDQAKHAAKHRNLPAATVEQLVSHQNPVLRASVACQNQLDDGLRRQLMADPDPTVRDASLRHQLLLWGTARGVASKFFGGSMERIVQTKPATIKELSAIDQVTPQWVENHGNEVLAIVNTAVKAAPVD